MFITICVIAYNEEQTLPAILKDIAAQDYAHGSMEVVRSILHRQTTRRKSCRNSQHRIQHSPIWDL